MWMIIVSTFFLTFSSCTHRVVMKKKEENISKKENIKKMEKINYRKYIIEKNEHRGWRISRYIKDKKRPSMNVFPMSKEIFTFFNELKFKRYKCSLVAFPLYLEGQVKRKNNGNWIYQIYNIDNCEKF